MTKIFSFAALLAVLSFVSCKKEEDEGKLPNIAFKTSAGYVAHDTTVAKNTSVTMGITASKAEPNDVLITFDLSRNYDGSGVAASLYNVSLTGTQGDNYSKDTTIVTRNQSGSEKYTFTVINRDGKKNSVSVTLTVN